MTQRKKIMITHPWLGWPYARQTPMESCQWDDCDFFINTPLRECDAWFVLDCLPQAQTTCCPRNKVFFIALEPQDICGYNKKFTDQFYKILACNDTISHPRKKTGCLGLPWHAGVKRSNNQIVHTYDDLASMPFPQKQKTLSTVCSGKNWSSGHRNRLAFTKAAQRTLTNQIEVFGEFFKPVDDKWDAIIPYKYHLAIENSSHANYWTEKLADAYLGYSMPIYWGCTNISDFFPKNAYISIDVTNIKSGLKKLEEIIHKDLTESQKDAISQARNMVLHKYNTFSILDSLASEQADETHETITLNPGKNIASQRAFTTKQKIRNLIRNGIHIPAK